MLTNLDYYNIINESDDNILSSDKTLSTEQSLNEYSLLIPKEWARGESDYYTGTQEKVAEVPHYELHIERQIGTYRNRRPAYVYLRLPKSKRVINIILHTDGGVSFDPKFHKYAIRELDELDRRIILGFCDKYHTNLVHACYSDEPDTHLQHLAATYKASYYKKRIRQGSSGKDSTDFYLRAYGKFEPYEESVIFRNVRFI